MLNTRVTIPDLMSQRPHSPPISLADSFPAASEAQWSALVDKVLKGDDFTKRLVTRTPDGIEIAPLYKPSLPLDHAPAATPHARGWRIAQLQTQTSASAMATAIADDVAGGADAVTIQLAAPGQSGLALTDLEPALAAVSLEHIRLTLQPGAHAIDAAQAWSLIAGRRSVRPSQASPNLVSLGIDPLGTLARTGQRVLLKPDGAGFITRLPWLPAPGLTLLADAGPYHEAGASQAQEIAALAATLVAYLRACEADGIPPAVAAPGIGLAMAVDADLFLGIAKLRAARRVVARICEACGVTGAAARMQIGVTTSARMMSRRDPWVNLLRVSAACTAAAIGGADEITVLPHTWPLGQPDAFARRIARNVGLVLREEAGLGRIIDPAAGSWFVEHLTDSLAVKAWTTFQTWESRGGIQAVLVSGRVQDEIAAVAAARDKDIATRRVELTGISAYPQLGDQSVAVEPWPMVTAPAARSARPLSAHRLAEPFERLRDVADAAATQPNVFLAALGTNADHSARSMWISSLLATGGIGVIAGEGITNSADAGRAFADSGAKVAFVCSSDQVYGELAEAAAMALKGAGATHVYLAGRPGSNEAHLTAAGIDGFVYASQDAIAFLTKLQTQLGLT